VTDKIPGYRDLTELDLKLIAAIKDLEASVGSIWAQHKENPDYNPRDMALAKTYMEEAFSRWVKAIARPNDPYVK
jgi:hypothetical protein